MSNQNVYDTANQLEREIRQLPEVAAIRQALAGIEADETSKTLFESYKQQVAQRVRSFLRGIPRLRWRVLLQNGLHRIL